MTTTTNNDNLTNALETCRRYRAEQAARIERARRRGWPTQYARATYAREYEMVVNARRAERLRRLLETDGLEATLLEITRKVHLRKPVGVHFRTIAAWALAAGITRSRALAGLKRLHAAGRIEYTQGDHRMDCGLWHPIHSGARRDIGKVLFWINEIDPTHYQADTEVCGCVVYGTGQGEREAVANLGRRLQASGWTGRLVNAGTR